MVVFPNAKINIGLRVIRKRQDGYHELVSCLLPVPFHDVLEIVESKKAAFAATGIPIPGKAEENLCIKAYHMLKKDFQLPEVSMHLHKLIPMGAGMGGGSADAAFVLKVLNEMFELFMADNILEDYAARLGSDCPFFIQNRPRMAYGTGHDFEDIRLDLSGKYLALLTPHLHIATAEAYAGISAAAPDNDLKTELEQHPVEAWKDTVKNDFEESLFPKYPVLPEIKDKLYQAGALYASMSGSGSTLYGIFREKPSLQAVFQAGETLKVYQL